MSAVNPHSSDRIESGNDRAGLVNAVPEQVFQFEREGYFVADRYDHHS